MCGALGVWGRAESQRVVWVEGLHGQRGQRLLEQAVQLRKMPGDAKAQILLLDAGQLQLAGDLHIGQAQPADACCRC
jgi:hypothetical protein